MTDKEWLEEIKIFYFSLTEVIPHRIDSIERRNGNEKFS